MNNHTSGPWNLHHAYDGAETIVRGDDGKRWISRSIYVAQGKKIICEVIMSRAIDEVDFGWPRVSDDAEFFANARLIAAAPELLEVLKDSVQILKDAGVHHELYEDKEKLIAKAEGESK